MGKNLFLSIMLMLLSSSALIADKTEDDRFIKAIQSGDGKTVESMLKQNKALVKLKIELKTKFLPKAKVPMICWAASLGQSKLIPILLKYGASLDEKGENPNTLIPISVLGFAARSGHVETVKDLFSLGVKPDSKHVEEFYAACVNGHANAAALILFEIKKVNKNPDLSYAFFDSVYGGKYESVKLIVETGIDVNVKNNNGFYAIYFAAWTGDLKLVKLLFERGAKINLRMETRARTYEGKNILHFAAISGNADLVSFLIKQKVKYGPSSLGTTPLHEASEEGHVKVIGLLLDYGAKPNELDVDRSPLFMAASYGHAKACELLLKRGAKIDYKNENGISALNRAATSRNAKDNKLKKNHLECVKVLLKHGAKVHPNDIKYALSPEIKALLQNHK